METTHVSIGTLYRRALDRGASARVALIVALDVHDDDDERCRCQGVE